MPFGFGVSVGWALAVALTIRTARTSPTRPRAASPLLQAFEVAHRRFVRRSHHMRRPLLFTARRCGMGLTDSFDAV